MNSRIACLYWAASRSCCASCAEQGATLALAWLEAGTLGNVTAAGSVHAVVVRTSATVMILRGMFVPQWKALVHASSTGIRAKWGSVPDILLPNPARERRRLRPPRRLHRTIPGISRESPGLRRAGARCLGRVRFPTYDVAHERVES